MRKEHEANIQAEFYHQARLIGLPVELELRTPFGRLDIAVLSHDFQSVVAIVECKNQEYPNPNSNQMRRYKAIGLPTFILHAAILAAPMASNIKRLHSESIGIRVADILLMESPPRRRHYRRDKAQ